MHVLSAFGSPAEVDRYSANSYTRGGLGHRSTKEAARALLGEDEGYVFDTKLNCVVMSTASSPDARRARHKRIRSFLDELPTDGSPASSAVLWALTAAAQATLGCYAEVEDGIDVSLANCREAFDRYLSSKAASK